LDCRTGLGTRSFGVFGGCTSTGISRNYVRQASRVSTLGHQVAPSRYYVRVMVDRILAVAGDTDGKKRTAKLRAFRQFMLLHGAVRSWLWLAFFGFFDPLRVGILAGILTLCFGFALVPKAEHAAPRLAFPVLLLQIIWTREGCSTHQSAEAGSSGKGDHRSLPRRAARPRQASSSG